MRGDYAAAAAEFETLREIETTRVEALIGLSRCRLATGAYDEVRSLHAEAKEAARGSAEFVMLAGEAARHTGDYETAIALARSALQIDPRHAPARLLLCETLEIVGKRDEALAEYEWFERLVLRQLPTTAPALTAVGQGFYRYSQLTRDPNLTERTRHVLNKIFQVAYEQVDRNYWPARVAAADLLRAKWNDYEAREDYLAALDINTSAVEALVGLGRLDLEEWAFEAVDARATAALAINSNSVAALNLRAACRLLERRYREAAETAERALAVNPHGLEAIALKASALLALDDRPAVDALLARGAAINPCNRVLHHVVADTLSGLRRFEESEVQYRKAIDCEPTAADPRTELGMMYMQWGDEARARDALEGAWRLDPFNARTKNTLELLDRLDRFVEIVTDRYVIRYDAEHDEVIAGAFARQFDAIYDEVCAAFQASLERKTVVEIFPSHTEFGVRIHGKPWIHTIGACTGWVIAMDAPRVGGDLAGPFNFAEVLRHEFTHTVTLAVTHNRIPHWLTEGLAVLQEPADRPYAWLVLLADAVRRDELYTLASIDWGFMRPRKASGRVQAYAQSEWMCEYLIETYGPEVIQTMLAQFADGRTQAEVFAKVTGESQQQFDARFAEWARTQAQRWGFDLAQPERVDVLTLQAAQQPDDVDVSARLARAQLDAEDWDAARATAKRCLEADESHPLAMEIFVRCSAHALGEVFPPSARVEIEDEAAPVARRLLARDENNRHALALLASLHMRRKQFDDALPLLTRLHKVWPIDANIADMLGTIHFEREEFDLALPYLLTAARSESNDAELAIRIAAIYERDNRLPDARHWYTEALHRHPLLETPREHLAEIAMRTGDVPAAIEEYRTLCKIAPHVARYHADCALAYRKLGDRENMRHFAERAVALDRNSPAAALLQESRD